MATTNLTYRLRIRNAADDGDELVVTSLRGGTNPYIERVPNGDGQEIDPLTGKTVTGAYVFLIVDAETGASTRVVTSKLADVNARQQLISRRAFGEISDDGGSGWDTLVAGFVTGVRLVSPMRFEIAVGETRRIEITREIFKRTTTSFDKVSCLIGGPVRGGFGPVRDLGGWKMRVTQIRTNPAYVQLKLISGNDPRKNLTGLTTISTALSEYINEYGRPYWEQLVGYETVNILGHFPGLKVRIENTSGVLQGTSLLLTEPQGTRSILRDGVASLFVQWNGTAPTLNQDYLVYVFSEDIGEENPLHIVDERPADLVAKLWDDAGIAYDSASVSAANDALGPDRKLRLRITQSYKLGDFLQKAIYGPFGLNSRINDDGERELFSTRVKSASTPADTITIDDLRDYDGVVFDVRESTAVTKVTFKQTRFEQWKDAGANVPPVDAVLEVGQTVEVENSDTVVYGDKEIVYEIPGQMVTSEGAGGDLFTQYAKPFGEEIYDRWGRGAIIGALHCLPTVTAQIGDEIGLDIPQLPNAQVGQSPVSQRGGLRIVQIVKRTETPAGPDLEVIDSGTDAQPSTLPTFTLVANPNDPRKYADIAITNAGTLASQGSKVRIEIGFGATEPDGGVPLTVLDPATATSITSDGLNAGSHVWVRVRAEQSQKRPSAWTAWDDVELDALDAVTGLAAAAQAAIDPSVRLLTWVLGANAADIPIEILLDDVLEVVLPPSSTQYYLDKLTVANRTAAVRHREAPPYSGASPDATVAVNTTGTLATLAAPIHPAGFAGSLNEQGILVATGEFGLEVTATELPSLVEVSIEREAPGLSVEEAGRLSIAEAGSLSIAEMGALGGNFSIGTVPSVQGSRTRWSGYAPNDGYQRTLKARHVQLGYTTSSYTREVTVEPWSPQPPVIRPQIAVTATPIELTGYVLVTAASSTRGVYRVYRKQGGAASVVDELIYTSPPDKGSISYTDTTGAASTEYNYLVVLTDPRTGATNDTSLAECRAIAEFPGGSTPGPAITYILLSGTAYNQQGYFGPTQQMDFEIPYTDANAGNYLHLYAQGDFPDIWERVAEHDLGAGGSDTWFTGILLDWISPPGPLQFRVDLTVNADPSSTVLDTKNSDETTSGYRWWTAL